MRVALIAALGVVGVLGCSSSGADEPETIVSEGKSDAQAGATGDGSTTPGQTDPYDGVAKPVTPAGPPTAQPPGPVVDAGAPPPATGCTAGTLYCGGTKVAGDKATVYKCAADTKTGTVVSKCANGCVDGKCNAPTKCVVGGTYCGGDKVNGDPNILYTCTAAAGTATAKQKCANGCVVSPAGKDDVCK